MATASGIALLAACLLLLPRDVTSSLRRARWPRFIALLGLGGCHAIAIARL